MLFVVILFLPASILVPVAEGLLASRADDLPFGLDNVGALRTLAVLIAALLLTFAICALLYYVVPKGHVPWRGVWPGALFVTRPRRSATPSSRLPHPVEHRAARRRARLHPHRPDLVLLREPHADGGGGDQRPALRAPRHRQRRGGTGAGVRRDGIAASVVAAAGDLAKLRLVVARADRAHGAERERITSDSVVAFPARV